MDMVDFVGLASTGTIVLERGSDELVRWVLLRLSDGRQLRLAERTYRDGTKVLGAYRGRASSRPSRPVGGMEL